MARFPDDGAQKAGRDNPQEKPCGEIRNLLYRNLPIKRDRPFSKK
jgi:hypothetical protein